ncbi:MAG: ketopantoate reductase family protein [Anaerolineae bacterium]
MKILVYGAGPLGSLFAAQLHAGGHDVSLLARGQRLSDIREHGVVIHNVVTDEMMRAPVHAVEALAPDDAYDLVLVIMRKNAALGILPILAANRQTPNVLFLMNNAAGPEALVEALGRDRVLIGFPASAGYRDGLVMHCLTGTPEDRAAIPFGEVDGTVTPRARWIGEVLESTPGLGAEIRTDMDAWLKYHVALVVPGLAAALYACGTDTHRLARTRDAVVLCVRAVREAFRALQALGYPVTPARFKPFARLPEPLLVPLVQKLLDHERMEVALAKHAEAVRDEMQHLTDEFLVLAEQSAVPIPTIRRLYRYFDPNAPLIPDGSRSLPLDWRGLATAGLALGAVGALVASIAGRAGTGRRER